VNEVGATSDRTHPRRDGRLEARLPGYRFGIVLVLLFVTFVFLASAPSGAWVRPVTIALQGLTLLAALVASQVRRVFRRLALLVILLSFVGSLVTLGGDDDTTTGVVAALNVLFVGAAPVAIASSVWRRRVIDIHTVLGALCIYVLLGMLWAYAFTAIGSFDSGPFFAQRAPETTANYLYFSFVTLTTTGYGDLTAAGGLGRAVAVLEALLGQIYLVTVVALLVSNLGRGRRDEVRTGAADQAVQSG
jgi:drug/metabolite transporter (DMT)-like permease